MKFLKLDLKGWEVKDLIQQSIRWVNKPEPKSIFDTNFTRLRKHCPFSDSARVEKFAQSVIDEAVRRVNAKNLRYK